MKITRRKLLWGAAALAAGAGGYKMLRGFEDDPTDNLSELIPPGLRNAGLDVHVHVLGVGAGGTGCRMHDEMRSSIQARAGLWNLRLSLSQPDLDQAYIEYLRTRVHRAGFLKQVVLLAMDHTYSSSGEPDAVRTPFYTPNDYVAGLCAKHAEFLFGASIHPYRPDALEELDRVAERGAVLVKWIPNVQAIDLRDARCRAFYKKLAQYKIALLPHVGDEQAMFVAGQEFGDPRRLDAALEEGVTVIAAHVASLGERDGRSNMEWLIEMIPRWPNLYCDTSALTLITRWRTLRPVIENPALRPRLVHGSDFPIPPASTMYFGSMPMSRWWNAWKRENALLRDFIVKQSLGMPPEAYTRGYEILAPRLKSETLTGS
jgi:predicted TIM-barrel fold metal-dependent hydrolase